MATAFSEQGVEQVRKGGAGFPERLSLEARLARLSMSSEVVRFGDVSTASFEEL